MITFNNFVFDNKSYVAAIRLNDGEKIVSLKDIGWEKHGEVHKGKLFEVWIYKEDGDFFASHKTPVEIDEILIQFQK